MDSKSIKISTGIEGLDEILLGGLISNRAYLLQGGPGSGKSTISFHFLSKAIQNNEKALYISLGEPKDALIENAGKLGIDLEEVDFLDLTPEGEFDGRSTNYNVFSPAEIEQKPIIEKIVEAIETKQPDRIVFDSITMLRFLNKDAFQYRNLGLTFVKFVAKRGGTLLMISESTDLVSDRDSVFWVDGVINVQYAANRRKIQVTKYRGSDYLSGIHSFRIGEVGVNVYPRLRPNNYERAFENVVLSSGIEEIDRLLHDGIEKGTTTLLTGPSGVGKTTLGLQFIKEAASRNRRSALYTFEESRDLIVRRSKMINVPIMEMIEKGNLKILPIEPLSLSSDEFSKIVRTDVEENATQMVMIDSMGGYGMAVGEEDILERLHSLTVYLQNMGVTTFLTNETEKITGEFSTNDMHASYLADNIVFLRYLEINGEMRKAIGVLKKRLSDFENKIREFQITSEGIKVGEPLHNLRGILSGLPEFIS